MWQKFNIIIVCIFMIFNEEFIRFTSTERQYRRLARVDRIEVCNFTPNAALQIKQINVINPTGQNVLVNIKAEMIREMRREPKLVAYVTRCLNKESLDTCVPFTVLKPVTTCGLIAMGNMAWSGLINAFHPALKCPFHKGPYELINGTLDPELFKFFPIDSFYWKAKLDFIEDVDFLSICADLRSIRVLV